MPETALAAAWQERAYTRPLRDESGRHWQVIFPGRRGGGAGPDFRDAVLASERGEILRGDVEIHRQVDAWYHHGHDQDPAYNGVALQVVGRGPAAPVRRQDGTMVPSVVVAIPSPAPVVPGWIVCPPDDRDAAALALDGEGDVWFAERQERARSAIDVAGPDQAVWAALLDALGYGGDRANFAALAETAPWDYLGGLLTGKPTAEAEHLSSAVLLGAAGLLQDPEKTAVWRALGSPAPLGRLAWQRHSMRPANRPERRLEAAASLSVSLRQLGPAEWTSALVREQPRPAGLTAAVRDAAGGRVGAGRAAITAVNVVLPFATVFGEEGASALFRAYPRLDENAETREMTDLMFAPDARHLVNSARRQQGLLRVYRRWCRDKNCAECPVGTAARGLG